MLWAVLTLSCLYLAMLFGIAWFSVRPFRSPLFLSPAWFEAQQYDVEFESEPNIMLKGWWIPAENSRAVAVISHGYMMNRAELTPVAVDLARRGCSCLVYDFRAHGKSGGKICGAGGLEVQDVIAAVAEARRRHPDGPLLLLGSSMGAAASAMAANHPTVKADALVLDSAYSRLPSAILGWWRFLGGKPLAAILSPTVLLGWPMTGTNPFQVDVAKSLKPLQIPVLILHGDADSLALPEEATRNQAACAQGAEVVWFAGCGHSEGRWLIPDLYEQSLYRYLGERGILAPLPDLAQR